MSHESFFKYAEGFIKLRSDNGMLWFPYDELAKAWELDGATDIHYLGSAINKVTLDHVCSADPERHYHATVRLLTTNRTIDFKRNYPGGGVIMAAPIFVEFKQRVADWFYIDFGTPRVLTVSRIL